MDISTALLNTQNPDVTLRTQAEEFLNNALQAQMGQFMVTLVQALATEDFAVVGRQAAGLYLKNVLDAKDDTLQAQKVAAWMAMDASLRSQIKDGALSVLSSTNAIARHTSAQLVAKLASIELPANEWPTLLDSLLSTVTSASSPEGATHAALECLGYLCDELEETDLAENDTNRILTAIVDGIRPDRTPAICLAAVTALRNSMEFVAANFQREAERDVILRKICEATQSADLRTRVVAYECIATVATYYYEHLTAYMPTLCTLTFAAIQNDQDEVGLQSLEFWSSICDAELEIAEDLHFAELDGTADSVYPSQQYVLNVLPTLLPLLTNTMKQQDEDQDEDSWNLSMAAATCLALVAQVVGDACVELTMTFIQANIDSVQWREKEAAIMAFGSILDGPSTTTIAPLVQQALGFLMGCMSFDHILVRDTTAWTLGRICELHYGCISGEMLPALMQLFLQGLNQEPRVAHNVCYAIHNIVKAFEESDEAAHMLSPYFATLFDKLLETSGRADGSEANLRGSAYEAVNMLIQVGADEVNDHIMSRIPVLLERLEQSIQSVVAHPDDHRDDPAGLQALLCGVLIAAIQKMSDAIAPLADRIMQALLQVFATRNAAAAEEAFMAAGAVANAVGPAFAAYMEYFGPVLLMGLRNSDEYMVCSVAVGVVGDLCRSLDAGIKPLGDEIVTALIAILKNGNLNRSVKPPVLSCFGDIALALEGEFERYALPSLQMILQAAGACGAIATDDDDVVEYMNQLRESVLEALTGIVQGLGAAHKATLLLEFAPQIGAFLSTLAHDQSTRTEAVTVGAVGLIGDMAQSMGKAVVDLSTQQFVTQLVSECASNSDNPQAQQLASWTQKVLMELRAN